MFNSYILVTHDPTQESVYTFVTFPGKIEGGNRSRKTFQTDRTELKFYFLVIQPCQQEVWGSVGVPDTPTWCTSSKKLGANPISQIAPK